MPSYWFGETVRIRVAFTDDASAAADVAGAEMKAKAPDGTVTVIPLEGDGGTGLYRGDIVADQAGNWHVRATCATPSAAAAEAAFTVAASSVI